MRSARVVRLVWLFTDVFVPVLAISVETTHAVPLYCHVFAPEDECGGLVLVADIQGVVQPVRYVGTPLGFWLAYFFSADASWFPIPWKLTRSAPWTSITASSSHVTFITELT